MLKKLWSVGLLLLIFVLAACSGNDKANEPAETDGDKKSNDRNY